ncbi:MAG: hypothetical protein ACKOLA_03995, partial [Spartobacteria bacterium]
MGDEFFRKRDFGLGFFITAAGGFLVSLGAFFYRGQVGENEFGVDDFDVAHGIDRSRDMVDVAALKTPHHLNNRINLS